VNYLGFFDRVLAARARTWFLSLSRRDRTIIARDFNAGKSHDHMSPEGTVERCAGEGDSIPRIRPWVRFSAVPSGLSQLALLSPR
jgi:hypothetical protein